MELSPTLDTDGIIDQLSQTYPRELVLETLKSLEDFQNNDVIFSASWTLPFETNGDRLKIYVPQSRNEWFLDPETISGGTNVALYHTTRSLSQFADVYLSSAVLV